MVRFATQVKRRRGTAAQNDAFTGAEGEIVVNLTDKSLRVHDGTTQGGFETLRQNMQNSVNITNCITKIPQDVKLELKEVDGVNTLILKAGSVYYVPNGVGVFEKRTITTDLVFNYTGTASGQRMVLITASNRIDCPSINNVYAGDTQPTQTSVYWYDTTNNVVNAVTGVLTGGQSLALGVITVTNGVITSIDEVFNGFGYMGGTRFILPGVDGLAPNGFNDDGTYKSVKWTTTNVLVRSEAANAGNYIDATAGFNIGMGQYIYDHNTNYVYLNSISPTNRRTLTTYGHVTFNNGRVESYKTKTAFHAVDYNDTDFIAHQAMPTEKNWRQLGGGRVSSGTSFTVPSDGYVFSQMFLNDDEYLELISRENTSALFQTKVYGTVEGNVMFVWLPVSKGQTVEVNYNSGIPDNCSVYFFYANGAK